MDHYEVWLSKEDDCVSGFSCNDDGERAKHLTLLTNPVFDWSCEADSISEFSMMLHEHYEWEPYKPMRLAVDLPDSEKALEEKLLEIGYFIYEVDGGIISGANLEIDALKRPVKIRIRRRKMQWTIEVALIPRKVSFSLNEWSAILSDGEVSKYPRGLDGKIEHLLEILDEIEKPSCDGTDKILSSLLAARTRKA
ncbi:MAG: hypothetical protein HKL80_06120 [Acidimicrobiales bacterium]|nr:hypothetical protein [Acidimicrobiales bacterium]